MKFKRAMEEVGIKTLSATYAKSLRKDWKLQKRWVIH